MIKQLELLELPKHAFGCGEINFQDCDWGTSTGELQPFESDEAMARYAEELTARWRVPAVSHGRCLASGST